MLPSSLPLSSFLSRNAFPATTRKSPIAVSTSTPSTRPARGTNAVVLLDDDISCRRRRRRIGIRRHLVPRDVVSAASSNASPDARSDPPSVGIDLGTSHSAIAVAPGGKPQLIRLLPEHAARPFVSGGDNSASRAGVLLPSVVFYPSDESKPLVGTAALVAAAKEAAAGGSSASSSNKGSNLVRSSKRLMGKKKKKKKKAKKNGDVDDDDDNDDEEEEQEDSPFELISVPSRPKPLLPQDVAKEILGALLDAAEAHFEGQRPRRAVVSVPAYFGKEARAATEAAAVAAGLDRGVRLVREPVAAALGYGLRPGAPRDETVLVVDLGGGTFDVSLLEVGAGAVEVLSTGGDAALGGDDWDAALAEEIGSEFLTPAGVTDWKRGSKNFSEPAWQALLGAARAAKEALSSAPAVELSLSSASSSSSSASSSSASASAEQGEENNKKLTTAKITRSMLDDVGAPLFARAAAAIDEACYQSGVELGESVARWRESVARAERERSEGPASSSSSSSSTSSSTSSSSSFKLRPKRRPPVSRVLLVGGGTRMWGFDTFIENLTGLSPTKVRTGGKKEDDGDDDKGKTTSTSTSTSTSSLGVVDPDTSVAAGAALQAAMLDGDPALSGVVVLDVWQAGLARALAEARLAAEEGRGGRGAGGDDDDDAADDDEGDEQGFEDADGDGEETLVFSPAPPPPSKTKLRKQRARDAKRSLRSKKREAET